MFIEVKGKPKTVIIQKRTKANKWIDIGTVTLIDGIDYNAARNILCACPNALKIDYRLILRSKKTGREYQVLSSRSEDFYDVLEQMENDKTIYLMVDGLKMVANNANPYCMHLDMFIDLVRTYGGIAKVTLRTACPEDGYLNTYDVKYVNGKSHTISVFNS